MIGVVVVAHGRFAEELLATALGIVGDQSGVAAVNLLPHEGIPQLREKFAHIVDTLPRQDGVLVFVDMMGGTPCNAVLPLAQGQPIGVVGGVNLYMLVSALAHRSHLSLDALVEKVLEDGRRSVVNVKEAFLAKLR